MRHIFLVVLVPLFLAACGERVWAPQEQVDAVATRADGPPRLTLVTVLNKRSGSGEHTALFINASQRVLFDPAGSFEHHTVPERNDVLYGMSDRVAAYYVDYHARETYDVMLQTVTVTPEVAEAAKRAVEAYGAVPQAACTTATSRVLRSLPGFGAIGQNLFPSRLMEDFAELPGVSSQFIVDQDYNDNWQNLVDVRF